MTKKIKNVTLKIEKENLEFFKKYSKENKIEMSSFVRNLILDKIDDEITEKDEKQILKRLEKTISVEDVFKRLEL
ncbi:hypothetical protein JCM16776_1642 [Leptotrichia shahii]|uniref:Toxin-antitoxin system, antitoxin component, ribbon-helix-helix domain protein n=1 Tax=Leptotrichia shahii TaxID=157691 RepID=A0A510JSI2_9FUSO|nr:DUF6290 family protein [Leptotrichia shahii]BBM41415.1 hypothetical protein JCM16776_1642 [Leptotrichia shahii]